MRHFFKLIRDQRGATAVEYGLILAMIFLVVIAAIVGVTDATIDMWNFVTTSIQDA